MKQSPSSNNAPGSVVSATVVAVCALAFLAPLWIAKYPPFVDLPQHAAQLSIWEHMHDAAFRFDGHYTLNWRTPYLLVYLIALPFVRYTSPLIALKIVISLGVVALPAALWAFLRSERAGDDEQSSFIDPAFALLGFPLAYGFSLAWGFLNCALASAPALLLLALVNRQIARPSYARATILAALGVVLFYTHALIFGFTLVLATLIALARGLRAVARLWPLAFPFVVAVVWYLGATTVAQAHGPFVWAISWHRLLWSPALQLGHPLDFPAALVGVLFLVLPFIAHRPRRALVRALPLFAVVLAVLFAPHMVFGTAYVFGRFSVFLVPMLLHAFSGERTSIRPALARTIVVVVCLTWAGVLNARYAAFDEEARDWDAVEARMLPGKDVRAIVLWRTSPQLPGNAAVYEHFPMYYQADKGGLAGFSFAENFLSFARYSEPAESRVSSLLEQHPEGFDWRYEPPYDYYVVRSPFDVGGQMFLGAESSVTLVQNTGAWWLYRRVAPFPMRR